MTTSSKLKNSSCDALYNNEIKLLQILLQLQASLEHKGLME